MESRRFSPDELVQHRLSASRRSCQRPSTRDVPRGSRASINPSRTMEATCSVEQLLGHEAPNGMGPN